MLLLRRQEWPCAVGVCENTQTHGDGSVCDDCERHAFEGRLECPVTGVHLCDHCGEAEPAGILGGDSSTVWCCDECWDEVLEIPVQERDFQAVPRYVTQDHVTDALHLLSRYAVAFDNQEGALMAAIIQAGHAVIEEKMGASE